MLFQPRSDTRDHVGNRLRQGESVRWVKLAAEPMVVDGALQLAGTDGPDNLEVTVNQDFVDYTINGVFKTIPRSGAQRIVVEPGAMQDLVSLSNRNVPGIILEANAGDSLDQAYLYDGSLSAAPGKSTAYVLQDSQLVANGFTKVTAIIRSGRSAATLLDSSGSDKLESRDQRTTLTGPGYEVNALGYFSVTADSLSGGVDTADLYDSEGNDAALATMATVTVRGPGLIERLEILVASMCEPRRAMIPLHCPALPLLKSLWGNPALVAGQAARSRVTSTALILSKSRSRWLDQATLYGSTGADAVQADTRLTQLINSSSQIRAYDFPRTNVFARTG